MTVSSRNDAELAALVHSLEVHQAELEVQNDELIAAVEELRSTNLALSHARDRYRALHDLAPVALVTIDRAASIVDVNNAALALLGAERDKLVARRMALFVPDEERLAAGELVTELFRTGSVRDCSMTVVADGLSSTYVRIHGVVLREDGPPRAVLALVDVSAMKVADAARRELDRRAGEVRRLESLAVLAGGVAHDFNNLLAVMIAGTDDMRGSLDAASPTRESLEAVRCAALDAAELAHQMLAYAGRVSVSPRPTDVGAMICALEPNLRGLAKGTPLVLTLPDRLPWICCDAGQIRQLVQGLVVNSAEAMVGRPGAITITAHAATLSAPSIATLPLRDTIVAGPCIVLEVQDDGEGMDAATRARMFEPYYSTKFIGRGLGLAVVTGIVRSHHGTLAVESAPDRGTTVRIYLPSVPAPAASTAAPAASTAAPAASTAAPAALDERASATVLIVDDEPQLRRTLARALSHYGVETVTAVDGLEAVELVRAGSVRIDLVLMDLTMPRMNGLVAGAALRELRPELPIVLFTGYGDLPPHDERVFAAVLAKPIAIPSLIELLDRLLVSAP